MAPGKHSRFGPSSSTRWITCPGSVQVQNYSNDAGSVYAAEGTLMHDIAEKCLLNPDLDPKTYMGQTFDVKGYKIKFTRELAEAVAFYVDAIWHLKEDNPDATSYIEHVVSLASYGEEYEGIFGTADFILDEPFGTLIVADLKGGKGVSVPATASQPKLYAVMAAGKLLLTYEKIITIIIQPRDRGGEQYKMATHDPQELHNWVYADVLPAIKSGRSDNPKFYATEDACRWCDASGKCKYQAEMALNAASEEFMEFDDMDGVSYEDGQLDVDLMTSDDIAKALKLAPLVNDWIVALQDRALEYLMEGHKIPGYKAVEKRTHRKWDPDADEEDIKKFLQGKVRLKISEIYKTTLRTPTQILKLTPSKKKEDVEEYIIKPKGAPTIAPLADKRPPIVPDSSPDEEFEDMGDLFS